MNWQGLRVGLVGPLPPPAGGMANQTRQLAELLEGEGAAVTLVQTNAPYRPAWIGGLAGVRALFRLLPYLLRLWRCAGEVQLFHGLVAFETVRAVFQHPRCQNCHPAGDAPLQGDEGRPHAQNVRRGPKGEGVLGLQCTTCHVTGGAPAAYGRVIPPATSKDWHMPGPDMKLVFAGLSPRELCEQVKDPARNGGKDMPALRQHLADPLVAWGWSPGVGRTPIPTRRELVIAAWETWAAAGAPCPD